MEQKSSNDEPKVRKKRGLFYCFKKENYQQLWAENSVNV